MGIKSKGWWGAWCLYGTRDATGAWEQVYMERHSRSEGLLVDQHPHSRRNEDLLELEKRRGV
eukprot:3673895-Amphidinium_carterae.1